MREWTLNGNSSADMDKSLPMNAATTEAISSVNQINDCISADPLETGLYNLRFYTLCAWFPLLSPSILTCYQFGEKNDTFLGVAEVVSNIKFSTNLFATGFHLSL